MLNIKFEYLSAGNIYFKSSCIVLRMAGSYDPSSLRPLDSAMDVARDLLQLDPADWLVDGNETDPQPSTFLGQVAKLAHHVQVLAGVEGIISRSWREVSLGSSVASFSCRDRATGQAAAALAISILTGRQREKLHLLAKSFLQAVNPWTTPLAKAASARGIPISVVAASDRPFLSLGHGSTRRVFWKNFTPDTSYIATTLSTRKDLTSRLLREAGLPAPRNVVVSDAEVAVRAADSFGYPVVVKPVATDFGRGVTVDNQNSEQVFRAFQHAARWGHVMIEQQIFGDNHRLLVVHGRCIRVMRTLPASVTGDGELTVSELVNKNNFDRKDGLTAGRKITLDDQAREILARQGLTPSSVPRDGQNVLVSANSNRRNGASAELVTELAHPEVLDLAVKAAALFGIDVAGIDYISSDITRSPAETGGAICEVNVTPGLLNLDEVALSQLEPYFAEGCDGRISTVCLVRKLDRKTRLNEGLFSMLGPNVCCSDSVHFWDETQRPILPRRTAAVLADPQASAALISCSSDELKMFGLGTDHCSLAIIEEGVSKENVLALLRIASIVVMPLTLYEELQPSPDLIDKTNSIWLFGANEDSTTSDFAGWVSKSADGKIQVTTRFGTALSIDCPSASIEDEILVAAGAAMKVSQIVITEALMIK